VHYSTIDGVGFKTLKEGQVVQYEASESPRGVQTTRVVGDLPTGDNSAKASAEESTGASA